MEKTDQNAEMPLELRSRDIMASTRDPMWQISSEKLKYQNCFFGFLDILGYKSLIDCLGPEAPSEIFSILRDAYSMNESMYESIKLKIMSDSLIVWSENENQILFWNLINVIDLVRLSFQKRGLLIRGGISVGEHFASNDVLISKALIRAYELERSAIYPRIVVDEEAPHIGLNNLQREKGGREGVLCQGFFRVCDSEQFTRDPDGKWVLRAFHDTDGTHFLRKQKPVWYRVGDKFPDQDQCEALRLTGLRDLIELRANVLKAAQNARSDSVIMKHNYIIGKFNDWLKLCGAREIDPIPEISFP